MSTDTERAAAQDDSPAGCQSWADDCKVNGCRGDCLPQARAAIAQPAEPERCADCRTPNACSDGLCLEVYISNRIDELKAENAKLRLRTRAQADAQPVAQYRRLLEPYAVFDAEGLLGPQKPFSWETVARVAVDFANAALAAPPARQPLPRDPKNPHAIYVNGFGWVDVKAVRAIEAAHGITQEGE